MRATRRRKFTGRRRVEEGEFCKSCGAMKHAQEMFDLRDKVERYEHAMALAIAAADAARAALGDFDRAAEEALNE